MIKEGKDMVTVTLDPNDKYTHLSNDEIRASLGILPTMIVKALNDSDKKVWDSLEDQYVTSLYEFKDATIDPETLVYSFPADSSLQPICVFERDGRKVTFYRHAMVGVCEGPGEKFRVTRMD